MTARLQFRPARADDRDAIVEMTREIWGGEDYLADVWLDWVDAPNSFLQVGLSEGQIVACGRLVALAAGEWWLEGMRVDPRCHGRGFSSQLHDHLVGLAPQPPDGATLGLATSWKNEAIAHLARRSGMVHRGRYRLLKFHAQGDASDNVHAAPLGDAITTEFAAGAWPHAGNAAMDGWVTRRVNAAWFRELEARGCRVWHCGAARAVAGPEQRRSRWWLYAMRGGSAAEQRTLARHLAWLAHRESNGEALRCFAPNDGAYRAPLVAAGFGDPWDGDSGPFFVDHYEMGLGTDR